MIATARIPNTSPPTSMTPESIDVAAVDSLSAVTSGMPTTGKQILKRKESEPHSKRHLGTRYLFSLLVERFILFLPV